MINLALFKQGLKSNYKIFLIFLALLTMYISVIISMYDPELSGALAEFAKSMPEFMAMVGMSGAPTTMLGYCITYLYGFLFLVIPMVVTIILANRLVASHTDRGSMAYLIASPNKRKKIIFTQMKVLGTFLFLIIAYITIVTIIVAYAKDSGGIEIDKLLVLNVSLLILHLAVASICFFASTISNETKNSLLYGAGIPVFFFLTQMLANAGGDADILKYISIFTLFDPTGIVELKASSLIMVGVLATIAFTLFFISVKVFERKDLSV